MTVGGSGHKRNGEPPTVSRNATDRTHDTCTASHPKTPHKTTRRRFTAEYKLRILREADRSGNDTLGPTEIRRAQQR